VPQIRLPVRPPRLGDIISEFRAPSNGWLLISQLRELTGQSTNTSTVGPRGGGVSVAFAQNWDAFDEYRYTDYGSTTVSLPLSQLSTTSASTETDQEPRTPSRDMSVLPLPILPIRNPWPPLQHPDALTDGESDARPTLGFGVEDYLRLVK
jgi:hypothetical protein